MKGAVTMTDLTVFPADIAEMSVSQLAQLTPAAESLKWMSTWTKPLPGSNKHAPSSMPLWSSATKNRQKSHCWNPAVILAPPTSTTDPCASSLSFPKKVTWDQKQLGEIAERVVASGEQVKSYIDIKLSVSESRYTNWPPALQQQFAAARTVEPGKPTFTLSIDPLES
jgi:hypothetical protein